LSNPLPAGCEDSITGKKFVPVALLVAYDTVVRRLAVAGVWTFPAGFDILPAVTLPLHADGAEHITTREKEAP
jgi:hypothetical protein